MSRITTIAQMDLAGGAACLDFVNTELNFGEPAERIHTYGDLLVLARRTNILDDRVIHSLTALSQKDEGHTDHVLSRIRNNRHSMFQVFRSLATGITDGLPSSHLKAFNSLAGEALSQRAFRPNGELLITEWVRPDENLMQPLWSFALSAYELLNTKDQKMIKQCGECNWLFLDETKNHRRKWCDMQTCGAADKSRRYYLRNKIKASQ